MNKPIVVITLTSMLYFFFLTFFLANIVYLLRANYLNRMGLLPLLLPSFVILFSYTLYLCLPFLKFFGLSIPSPAFNLRKHEKLIRISFYVSLLVFFVGVPTDLLNHNQLSYAQIFTGDKIPFVSLSGAVGVIIFVIFKFLLRFYPELDKTDQKPVKS